MLIVLEGLDGAGKSTQVNKLKDYLSKKTGRLEYLHFPRYDSDIYGDLISRFLRGEFGSNDKVHPQLVALLFAEDRHSAVPQIRAYLAEGKTVLLDRYVYSNIAYQCAKSSSKEDAERLRKWILNTEFDAFGEPRPDLNIFLDVPIGFVERNLESNRVGSDRNYLSVERDIHEASIDFQKKVRDMYLRQAEEDPSLQVLECSDADGKMLDKEIIFSKIRKLVDEVL